EHLSVALLSEPDAVAARVIHGRDISDEQFLASFGLTLPASDAAVPPEGEVPFSVEAKSALREALKAALRLGHNYIGTEHILLGLIRDEGETAKVLVTLGLTV